jgi:Zn-dependent protease
VSVDWIPSNAQVLALEDDIAPVFAVHDVRTRGGGKVIIFAGQFLRSPDMVYDEVRERFRSRGYIPLLRKEGDRDVLIAYPAPAVGGPGRPWLHGILFVFTLLSTLLAGTLQAMGPNVQIDSAGQLALYFLTHWTDGIPFAAALLAILGVHEFGHYFVARHYQLDVSLPYFIPFPLNPYLGTLGAVIRIQSPFESRKALFDVGIAGPLAGLAVAIPVVALGLAQAEVVTLPAGVAVDRFNEPLLFQWMASLIVGERGPGEDVLMNPLLMAGWWGFLITALNLVPISQLDGGHIAYGLFGRFHRVIAWGVFAVAALVAVAYSRQYVLMLGLVFFLGIEHPPALDDLTPLDTPRRVLGILTLLLFLTLITIDPFDIG